MSFSLAAGVGQIRQIVFHPTHGTRTERLDANRLESVEHRSGIHVHRSDPGMEASIVVAQAKCD